MSDRIRQRVDGTVEPAPGWAWCLHCDGQGEVLLFDSGPDMNEYVSPCRHCDKGLVAHREGLL